ncbi:MAG: hypothetical protein R2715_06710 [Ilumatobacteraceae bacterium]
MAERLAAAIEDDADARSSRFVVVGGGVARRYPGVVAALQRRLADRVVEPTMAPDWAKSAAPWGLRVLGADDAARPIQPQNGAVAPGRPARYR